MGEISQAQYYGVQIPNFVESYQKGLGNAQALDVQQKNMKIAEDTNKRNESIYNRQVVDAKVKAYTDSVKPFWDAVKANPGSFTQQQIDEATNKDKEVLPILDPEYALIYQNTKHFLSPVGIVSETRTKLNNPAQLEQINQSLPPEAKFKLGDAIIVQVDSATGKKTYTQDYITSEKQAVLDADLEKQRIASSTKKNPNPKDEMNLRKEFNNLAEVKYYKDTRNYYDKIGKTPDTATGDMAMIFNYMKMLDPASTVREGEYKTAEFARSVPDGIFNFYTNTLTGKKLTPTQRADFRNIAKTYYTAASERVDNAANNYRSYAEQAGLSPDNVVKMDGGSSSATSKVTGKDSKAKMVELDNSTWISMDEAKKRGLTW